MKIHIAFTLKYPCLPLLVTVLRHVPQSIEQLLGLLQEVAELVHDLPLVLLHVLVHLPHTDTGVNKNDTSNKLHSD